MSTSATTSTNDLFIIMGIPVTIEFLTSLRNSFQLLAIKNKEKERAALEIKITNKH